MRIDAVSISEGTKINQNKKSVEDRDISDVQGGLTSGENQIYHAENNQDVNHTFSVEKSEQNTLTDQVNGAVNQIVNTDSDKMQKLMDSGFQVEDEDVNTVVTVVDKIRVEMAKGGQNTTVFGEHIQNEQVQQVLNNPNLESEIEQVQEQAQSLEPMDDSTKKYMLTNELEPTVKNLYMAQHAGSNVITGQESIPITDNVEQQIDQIITDAGYEVDDTIHQQAVWMVENQIPLTTESIQACQELNQVICPPDKATLDQAIATAVLQGKKPQDANLKLQLEETRLVMTKEAVSTMEKQGITIDTSELEQTVQELKDEVNKQVENQTLQNIQDQQEQTTENQPLQMIQDQQLKELDERIAQSVDSTLTQEQTDLYSQINERIGQTKLMPSPVLTVRSLEQTTVDTLYEDGTAMKAKMEAASQSYETLMTAPRADLGDSMQKAFQNVDAILEDLELPVTEENQRAVRILSYNQQEITEESVLETKQADSQVQTVLSQMTPKVVLTMIQENYQPLDVGMEELSQKITEIQGQSEDQTQTKYSEFLWKLEQQGGISQEERDSFIGIYRLLHQVDQNDGSVVLAVQNAGEEVTLKNLLTQVRNQKARGMELSADDDTGEVEQVNKEGVSITDQIQAAYDQNCLKQAAQLVTPGILKGLSENGISYQQQNPEALLQSMQHQAQTEEVQEEQKAYVEQEQQQVAKVYHTSEEVIQYLEESEMPKSVVNLQAVGNLLKKRNQGMQQLFDTMDQQVDFEGIKEDLLEKFGEALKTPEDMAEAQKKLADTAEHVMKTMINEHTISSDELRDLKIVTTQMSIASERSKKEEYAIPVLVTDEMANVTLKIVHGKDDKGKVTVFFQTDALGKVAAELSVNQDNVIGYVASDTKDTLDLLQNQMGDESQKQYILTPDLSLERFQTGLSNQETNRDDVTTTKLYGVAREFLKSLSQLQVK